jgi:hypothetical protein
LTLFQGAGTPAGADIPENAVDGIAQGHAYSLLKIVEEDGHQLVCLRNPWGKFEWTGEFGDEWMRSKGSQRLKKLLNWVDADDGTISTPFLPYFDPILTPF